MNAVSIKKQFKVSSFFAGIGGFDLGLEKAGMDVVFQCEWNNFCQKILKKHWPNVPLMSDINDVRIEDMPNSNVWCGGFPCQDVSLANQGKRKGLNGERSGLFFKIAELIEHKKPDWVILENVPGLLNSNQGKDFKVVLQTLGELGYGVSWRVLDAKYFGTPQRRRRVFVVASLGNISSSKVLFEPDGVVFAHRTGLGQKEATTYQNAEKLRETNLCSIQHASIGRKSEAGPQAKGYRNDGETYTLDSRGSSDAVCKAHGSYRVRTTTRLPRQLDSARYRALGNAVCVPIVEWIGRRVIEFS